MSRSQAKDGFNPTPGLPETIAPGVTRILAPNPSPMTFRGTNTYLIGEDDLAVIDPGPASEAPLSAILSACGPRRRISHILVTHSHLDHSPLAAQLRAKTGAHVFAFGTADAGRSAIMQDLAARGLAGGGEGIDQAFDCDHRLADGAMLTGPDWQLEAIHTPGHIGNHLCFALGDILFSGDHVMGWASSLVSPPDGDLTDFMLSCHKLQQREWSQFLPGHGAPILDPHDRLDWLITHRRQRETAILDRLREAPCTAADLTLAIYTDTPAALLPAAERNVLSHLVDLTQRGAVHPINDLSETATFAIKS